MDDDKLKDRLDAVLKNHNKELTHLESEFEKKKEERKKIILKELQEEETRKEKDKEEKKQENVRKKAKQKIEKQEKRRKQKETLKSPAFLKRMLFVFVVISLAFLTYYKWDYLTTWVENKIPKENEVEEKNKLDSLSNSTKDSILQVDSLKTKLPLEEDKKISN